LREKVEAILEGAKKAGVDCEIYGESIRGLNIEVYKGKIESLEYYDDGGVGIRVASGTKAGFAYTSDTSMESLHEAFSRASSALSAASFLDVDALAGPSRVRHPQEGPRGDLYRTLPSDFDIEVKKDGVLLMEQACYDADKAIVNTEGVIYEEVIADVFITGTRLEYMEERRGCCNASLSAVASRDGDVKSGWYYGQGQSPKDIDFERVGRLAALRAVDLIGSRQVKTGRYSVLMDEIAFATILRFIESILSGEKVAKGSSVLAKKLGNRVASDVVTLVDDPFLGGGCFNAGFDAEGLETRRNVLIEGGFLRRFLNNAYSARMLKTEPTANAVRDSYRSQPVPGSSNLYLVHGVRSKDEIIKDITEGLLVTDIMGLHTADSISGEFSFGVLGFYIGDGAVQYPVSEVTISGNIVDFLESIVELGKELVFVGSYGAPAVLVEGLSIGGE